MAMPPIPVFIFIVVVAIFLVYAAWRAAELGRRPSLKRVEEFQSERSEPGTGQACELLEASARAGSKILDERGAEMLKSLSESRKGDPRCGFCGKSFSTTQALWSHQKGDHDPDGIAYSDFGPK